MEEGTFYARDLVSEPGNVLHPDEYAKRLSSLKKDGLKINIYDEKKLKEYMLWDSIEIEVNLKLGNDAFKCYTCDFTHDYIDINTDYRN